MKGDLTGIPFTVVYPEQTRNVRSKKNFAKVVAGSNHGCRNCTVVLDALSSIFKSKERETFEFAVGTQGQTGTLMIECSLDMDFSEGRHVDPTHMEVFRQTGMSG